MKSFINPRQALNKAFLKVKPNRSDIETFKANLIYLLDHLNENEIELRKVFMEQIKVKQVDETTLEKCKNFIVRIKAGNKETMAEIDQMVYEVYALTEEEIAVVEQGTNN